MKTPRISFALFAAVLALPGCGATHDKATIKDLSQGEYRTAAVRVSKSLPAKRDNRKYLLQRVKLGMLEMADGRPDRAEPVFTEVFDVLRTQGVNDDKTVRSAVFWEGIRFWKGEPFEQALAFHYIGLQHAEMGQWDNARAAANSSLFLLKDFGTNEKGARKTTEDIAKTAQQTDPKAPEQKQAQDGPPSEYIDHGYTPVKTDFALGHVMSGLASLALGRSDEASDQFRHAQSIRGSVSPADGFSEITDRLASGSFNTVFVVDYGQGPIKTSYGMDNVFSRFEPAGGFGSDGRALRLRVGEGAEASFAAVCDVNSMAQDHKWNNMEDVRRAKSIVGTGLLVGGAGVAAFGGSDEAVIAGLAMMLAGALMKASAQADTTYCESMPQRIFLAPISLPQEPTTVTLQLGDDPATRLVLPSVRAPSPPERFQVRYVRLLYAPAAPQWAASGTVLYANDHCQGSGPSDDLPYILGGTCVRRPSAETLQSYQRAGCLDSLVTADLENLYRAEGIRWDSADEITQPASRHVLEGGDSLITPLPGTTGFARVFCRDHAPYRPRSVELKTYVQNMNTPRTGPTADCDDRHRELVLAGTSISTSDGAPRSP